MRKIFTHRRTGAMLFLAASLAACGGSDEADSADRDVDLALSADSLAALADTSPAVEEPAPSTDPPATARPRRDPAPSTPPARQPAYREVSVSAGTLLRVRLDQELSTEDSEAGQTFTVTLIGPATGEDVVAIPAGTKIQGEVTAVDSDASGEQEMILLAFGDVLLDGSSWPAAMSVTEVDATTRGTTSTEEKAVKIGAGAVVGGILGRVIGGNATGTIVGGVAGAAAGTAIVLATEGKVAVLESGSEMTLRVEETFTIRRPA